MKLIISDYIENLKERGELDRIVPELLSVMGLNVLTAPSNGTRQYGVDVSAYGKLEGDKKDTLYLFTIKRGNVTRQVWDGGAQGLRASINEITSKYINTSIPVQCKGSPIRICICFGGKIKEDQVDIVRNHIKSEQRRLRGRKVRFEEWNGDKLADLLQRYFLSERMLCSNDRKYLRMSLAMVSVGDVAIRWFLKLIDNVLSERVKEKRKRDFRVRQLLLCLGILSAHCVEAGNLEPIMTSLEVALLRVWVYLGVDQCVKKCRSIPTNTYRLFASMYQLYLDNGLKYLEKIEPYSRLPYGFAMRIAANNEIDVCNAVFKAIGRISALGLAQLSVETAIRKVSPVLAKKLRRGSVLAGKVVSGLIKNNPSASLPLLDGYSVDISLGMYFLYRSGDRGSMRLWMQRLYAQIGASVQMGRTLPCIEMEYWELLNYLNGRRDGRVLCDEVLSSSEFYAYILFVAGVLKRLELYNAFSELVQTQMPKCNLQMWFPNAHTEASFYGNRQVDGTQAASMPLPIGQFFKRINMELEGLTERDVPTCSVKFFFGLYMIGCFVNRVCVPAHCWLLEGPARPTQGTKVSDPSV